MDLFFTVFDWALGGLLGKKTARWAKRALFAALALLAYCAPTRNILWIANSIGQWKIAPYFHALEQTYRIRNSSR